MKQKQNKRKIVITICIVLLSIMVGVGIFRIITSPVLLTIPRIEACCGDSPPLAILNPFRDRSPETIAEDLLQSFKQGQCESAIKQTEMSEEDQKKTCLLQRSRTILKWSLAYRKDINAEMVDLYYTQWYSGGKNSSNLSITMKRLDGGWHVSSYGASY